MDRFSFLLLLLMCGAAACTNKLEGTVQTIDLTYIRWACSCAPWVKSDDRGKSGTELEEACMFIEAADSSQRLPDSLAEQNVLIRFTGQFYEYHGLPKDWRSSFEESPGKARIFRYTGYQVLRPPASLNE